MFPYNASVERSLFIIYKHLQVSYLDNLRTLSALGVYLLYNASAESTCVRICACCTNSTQP